MNPKHLTEEALLGLAGNRLPDGAKRAAEEHLAECASCRQEYADFRFAHSIVERMAEIGYQESLRLPERKRLTPTARPRRELAFPWGPVIAISLGCICVMAALFIPRMVPTASAAELLSDAMQHENREGDSPFRVEVSGQTCAGGHLSEDLVSFRNSDNCNKALKKVKNTPWGHGNPLSAKIYATWRGSLHHRHDRVEKRGAAWRIETTTDESIVQTASLELRATDYHTTKLTLGFADHEEVSILEGTDPLPTVPETTNSSFPAQDDLRKLRPPDDPADILEVQAWATLHRLNADSGWEAVVIRSGPQVGVEAVVRDDARKEEFIKAFASNPDVKLDLRSSASPGDVTAIFPPRSDREGDAPALATKRLKQQFTDPDQRAAFSNNVLLYSREILGRTFILEKLKRRHDSVARCTCAKDLAALIVTEKRELTELETALSTMLTPLVGSTVGRARLLTLVQAEKLDASLHELLWRSSTTADGAFDSNVRQIRQLLPRE